MFFSPSGTEGHVESWKSPSLGTLTNKALCFSVKFGERLVKVLQRSWPLLRHQFCWNSTTGLVDEILIVSPGLDICLYLSCVFICLIGGFKPYVGWWSPMANIYFSVGWSQQPVYLIVADTSRSFSWWKPQGHTLRASFSRFEVCQQGHCLIIISFIEKYIAATWDIPWHDIPWYSHL